MARSADKTLVNFRLPVQLLAQIDEAAQRAGLNRTEWVTSTLTVACREGLRAAAVAVATGTYGIVEGCAHPVRMRRWVPDGLRCDQCGAILRRGYEGA